MKARFLDAVSGDGAFAELYDSTYWSLYQEIYGADGGAESAADAVLDGLARTIPTSDRLSSDELSSAIGDMRAWVDERAQALAGMRG